MISAASLITAGIIIQVWSLRPGRAGARYALQLPAIFLYSLGGSLVLFTAFPESLSEGRALGFSLSGAAGFVAFFMLSSLGWLSRTFSRDKAEREVRRLQAENRKLAKRLTLAELLGDNVETVAKGEKRKLRVVGRRGRFVGMVSGNLVTVFGVDVWVNSENTRMEMSRTNEPTISAVIRYNGGERDGGGHLVNDLIASELATRMGDMVQVAPGYALSTSSGELLKTNSVKKVVHVAAVEGEPGSGYRPVRDLARCVHNVLAEIDRLNLSGETLRSVVMPLLGTGSKDSDISRTAETLIGASIDYLGSHDSSKIREVYLLAYTSIQQIACEVALEAEEQLMPNHGSEIV
ncbi:macro domain-containing protein [Streptomyces sp900116325]|uniref:macro domain-containing protein n=1 Tax=Streptomyces sp. 900116325 TaxID=3154295 RepID=UPI0033A92FDC